MAGGRIRLREGLLKLVQVETCSHLGCHLTRPVPRVWLSQAALSPATKHSTARVRRCYETCAVGALEGFVDFGDLLDAAAAVHKLVDDVVDLVQLVGAVDGIELGEAGPQGRYLPRVGRRLLLCRRPAAAVVVLRAGAERRNRRRAGGQAARGLVQRHSLEAAREAARVGARVHHAAAAAAAAAAAIGIVCRAIGDAVEAIEAPRIAGGRAWGAPCC